MNHEIGLTPRMFSFGAGIFFAGYFAFEVPSTIILHKVGARFWIGRVMITWGLVSVATAFIRGPISFCVLRFLLGLAEAGFFPESSCTSAIGSQRIIAPPSPRCSWRPRRLPGSSARQFPAP